MKKQTKAATVKVGLLRGVCGEDGENHPRGAVITCKVNLAKIIQSCGRGMIISDSKSEDNFKAELGAIEKDIKTRKNADASAA